MAPSIRRVRSSSPAEGARFGPVWLAPGSSALLLFGETAERRLAVDLRTGELTATPMERFDDTIGGMRRLEVAAISAGRLLVLTEMEATCLGPDGEPLWARPHGIVVVRYDLVPPGAPEVVAMTDVQHHSEPTRWLAIDDGRDAGPPG